MRTLPRTLMLLTVTLLVCGSTAAAQSAAPVSSEFSFQSTRKGVFRATVTLRDAAGRRAQSTPCIHSLWAAFRYSDDEPMQQIMRLITVESSRPKLTWNIQALPGVKKSNRRPAAFHMMVRTLCETPDVPTAASGSVLFDSNPDANYIVCGAKVSPSKVQPYRYLTRLRKALLQNILNGQPEVQVDMGVVGF